MDFKKLVLEKKDKMLEDLVGFLKINSELNETEKTEDMPFGQGIEDSLNYMLELAKKDGFKTYKDGGYAGHIEYGEGEEIIGILCHVDVVGVGKGWITPPYSADVRDGKVYARGSMDDKGPTIAAYHALKILKDSGVKLNKRVRIILGTDEETGWRGINHYFEHNEIPSIGFAPDADFPLIYGEKGIMGVELGSNYADDELVYVKGGDRYNVVVDEAIAKTVSNYKNEFIKYCNANSLTGESKEVDGGYEYTLNGVSAHAMEAFKGINAATHMCSFLSKVVTNPLVNFVDDYLHNDIFLEKLGVKFKDAEMGDLTSNVGIVDINNTTGKCCIDLRYPINFSVDNFKEVLGKKIKMYGVNINKFSDKVPHYVSKDSQLVKTLYNAYVEYTNDLVNQPKTIGGGTYARALKNAVAFGMEMPGVESVVHQKNEYLELETLYTATAIYAKAIKDLGE